MSGVYVYRASSSSRLTVYSLAARPISGVVESYNDYPNDVEDITYNLIHNIDVEDATNSSRRRTQTQTKKLSN